MREKEREDMYHLRIQQIDRSIAEGSAELAKVINEIPDGEIRNYLRRGLLHVEQARLDLAAALTATAPTTHSG